MQNLSSALRYRRAALLFQPPLYVALFCLCLLWSSAPSTTAHPALLRQPLEAVAYRLSLSETKTARYRVSITVLHPGAEKIAFAVPAWTPGYYQILHYERSIENVHAEDEMGRALPVAHPSPRVWEVPARPRQSERLILTYEVRASEKGLGFFDSVLNLREQQGYINGASAFMYLVGAAHLPTTLAVTLPSGWRLATPLDPAGEKPERPEADNALPASSARFQAKDYDELIDCPLQMGRFDSFSFAVENVPFQCILVGNHQADRAKLMEMLTRMAQAAMQSMSGVPFKRYLFIYHIGDIGFLGGLEHRSSTVIHLDDPIKSADDDDLVTTTAHEFIHAWNVKQIRPANLGPFDYTQPTRTASLWWAEGVTDYYADLIPVRAGLRSIEWFLKQQAQHIAMLDNVPARARVSLEEASRKAWEGQSEGFGGLSYYLKGGLVGFYFDLRIRELTANRNSLDDVMKDLDSRYGKRGAGYPEEALLSALNRVANTDLSAEYNRYVRGTDEITWEDVFPSAGMEIKRDRSAYLGFSFVPETNPEVDIDSDPDYSDRIVVIQRVESGYSAAKMGLMPGDRLLRVNGREVNYAFAGPVINTLPASSPVALEIQRNGRMLTLKGEAGIQYSHHALGILPETLQTDLSRQIRKTLFSRIEGPH